MKSKIFLVLVLTLFLVSSFSVGAEFQEDIVVDSTIVTGAAIEVKPAQQELLPINAIEKGSSLVFSFNIDENLYSINNTTIEFYISNGKEVFKTLLTLANCAIDQKTNMITVLSNSTNKIDIGKIIFIGKKTDDIDLEKFSVVKKSNAVKISSVNVKEAYLIKDSDAISIKIEDGSTTIKKADIIKQLSNNLLFVNRNNPLPRGYEPQNLVKVDKSKILLSTNVQKLLPITVNVLYKMVAQARKEGIRGFISNSTYRTLKE